MEEPVKSKQLILAVVAALMVVTGMLGCKKDDTAVKALQQLTNEQSKNLKTQHKELVKLAKQVEDCEANVAKTKGEAAVIKARDVAVETPELVGEASVESLEALKAALAETADKQEAMVTELTAAQEACTADLTAASEAAEGAAAEAVAEAEAAAAAAAADAEAAAKAAEEAAKKKAAAARAKRKAAEKPAMVKEQEEKGVPTKGADSAFKKRQ